MSEQTARPPATDIPAWARAHKAFVANVFNIRSAKDFSAAMNEFTSLQQGQREFYQAYLLHLQIEALATVHADLARIDHRLRGLREDTREGVEALDAIDDMFGEIMGQARKQAATLEEGEVRPHPTPEEDDGPAPAEAA